MSEATKAGSRTLAPRPNAWPGTPILAAIAVLGGLCVALSQPAPAKPPEAAAPPVAAPAAIPEKSIAVLPFANSSPDKGQDYFADGLTEEMIELLGQVPELHVPARTSSFYFKGKNEPVAGMAQQLKVAHLLQGSVRKSGKRLQITAQLIRADSGKHLWSQTYDRDNTDIFAVQDDIAKAVAGALKVKLTAGRQTSGSRGTTSTEAYGQYLLGRELYRRGNLDGYRHATEAYGKAVALDPNYAAAYAGLAVAEADVADQTGDMSGIGRAVQVADQAITLAPRDANGYAARSYIRTGWLWDWSGAQADIEKALAIDPRNSEVQHRYSGLLNSLGRLPQALAAQKTATDLDPLSSDAWESLGRMYMVSGNYASADAALRRAVQLDPSSAYALNNLGQLRLLQGNPAEGLKVFQKVKLEFLRLCGLAISQHALGHEKESKQALDELIARHTKDAAYQIAQVYAMSGATNKAFEWLERAYEQKDGGLSSMKTDPMLASLRGDPRFDGLLRRLKLLV
jgi:TolB-like protein/Tfp pilus assembly protein PilF